MLDPECLLPPDSVLYNGASGYEMANQYPALYGKAMAETLGPEFLIASQVGFAGMEKYAAIAWPEKPSSRADPHGTIRMAKLCLAGVPLTGPAFPVPQLGNPAGQNEFIRELGLASASGLMMQTLEVSKLPAPAPPELIKTLKVLGEIHARLFPYLNSLARGQDGSPLILPPALLDPGNRDWYRPGDEFMLGGSILVAPGFSQGAKHWVRFPPGKWVHLETLAMYREGVAEVKPQSGPLMFLREGEILPVFSKSFQTLAGAGPKGAQPGPLDQEITLIWLAGADAQFTLFDGGQVCAHWQMDRITLGISGGQKRSYHWRLLWAPTPLSVYLNGAKLDGSRWKYQDRTGILTIPGVSGPEAEVVVVLKMITIP